MIEIKTLKHNMEGDVSREDAELTEALNEGWEILSIAILDRNDDYSMLRVVTLKRILPLLSGEPAPVAAVLPADVIAAYQSVVSEGVVDIGIYDGPVEAVLMHLVNTVSQHMPKDQS